MPSKAVPPPTSARDSKLLLAGPTNPPPPPPPPPPTERLKRTFLARMRKEAAGWRNGRTNPLSQKANQARAVRWVSVEAPHSKIGGGHYRPVPKLTTTGRQTRGRPPPGSHRTTHTFLLEGGKHQRVLRRAKGRIRQDREATQTRSWGAIDERLCRCQEKKTLRGGIGPDITTVIIREVGMGVGVGWRGTPFPMPPPLTHRPPPFFPHHKFLRISNPPPHREGVGGGLGCFFTLCEGGLGVE